MSLKTWIHAIRPRTLPLALSCTILGSFTAVAEGSFKPLVLIFASLTTILLQILSNLANDFGDYKKGSDTPDRKGPLRMVASGKITASQMKIAIYITIFLAFISGSILIFTGLGTKSNSLIITFFIIGIAAIRASVKYTVGKRPYGYYGLGDLMVFIFFGIIGVTGTFFLHTGQFKPDLLLPAASIGLLSAGVLNLNNMRDYENDKKVEKRTLVVMIGKTKAKIYHSLLIIIAFITTFIYSLIHLNSVYQFLFLLALPLFINDIKIVIKNTEPIELNSELKKLALSTLIFSIAVGVGSII